MTLVLSGTDGLSDVDGTAASQAIRDKYAAMQTEIDADPGVPELKLIADALV